MSCFTTSFVFIRLCLQTSLRQGYKWKMGLTSLRSSFPSACRGGTTKDWKWPRHNLLLYMVVCERVPTTIYNKKSLACARLSIFGWKMGFEPTTFGTTIRHSNQLSYIHHMICFQIGDKSNTDFCYFQISALVFSKIGLNLFFLLSSTDYPACSQPSSGARAKWHLGA